MNLVLISENPEIFSSTRIIEEAKKQNLSVNIINPFHFQMSVLKKQKRDNPSYYFHRTTGLRGDDFDLSYAKQIEIEGGKIINPLLSLINFRDKLDQLIFINSHNLNIVPTISFRGRPTQKLISDISNSFNKYSQNKFVIKTYRGNQGIGVSIIESENSLLSILETFWALKDQKFIIQPHLSNYDEFRLFFVKNMSPIWIKKNGLSDFRKNSSYCDFLKTDNPIGSDNQKQILDFINLNKLEYCAIDILVDDNNYYILEVNVIPGFRQVETASQSNIVAKIISNIKFLN